MYDKQIFHGIGAVSPKAGNHIGDPDGQAAGGIPPRSACPFCFPQKRSIPPAGDERQ